MPEPCIPEADPANKLATFKAKAVKDKIGTPFPYVELSEFLPRWVTSHMALAVRRCEHIPPFCLGMQCVMFVPGPQR